MALGDAVGKKIYSSFIFSLNIATEFFKFKNVHFTICILIILR